MPCKTQSLRIRPSPPYVRMWVCTRTRTPLHLRHLKLRPGAESPHANSCLLSSPLVRDGEQIWQQPILGHRKRHAHPLAPRYQINGGIEWAVGAPWLLPPHPPPLGLQVWAEGGNLIWVLPWLLLTDAALVVHPLVAFGHWVFIEINADYIASGTLCQEDTWI